MYDPEHDRMILFGGSGQSVGLSSQTWSLSFQPTPSWTNLAPAESPPPRWGAGMIYDPSRRRIVLFGGNDNYGSRNDTWVFDVDGPPRWRLLGTNGTPPPGRRHAVVVYDVRGDRLIVHGGSGAAGPLGGTWALSFSGTPTWTRVIPTGAPEAAELVSTYDPVANRVLMTLAPGVITSYEVWRFAADSIQAGWSRVLLPSPVPSDRSGAASVYDPLGRRLLVHGGTRGRTDYPDVWAIDLSGPYAWRRLQPGGTLPEGRYFHCAALRTAAGDLVIFGGTVPDGSPWALRFVQPQGPPLIAGFSPAGGLPGDTVVVVGSRFDGGPTVRFGGAAAPVLESTSFMIRTIVPDDGAIGPLSIETPLGTGNSERSFRYLHVPVFHAVTPDSAKAGATVTLRGRYFLGATRVQFGPGPGTGAAFTVVSDSVILATVDTLSVTGPITVHNPLVGSSGFTFRVIPDEPRALLTRVRDVPGDQGGRVVLEWVASDYDRPSRPMIRRYQIWRHEHEPGPEDSSASLPATSPSAHWELAGETVATTLPSYRVEAATLRDSTDSDSPRTAFFVRALTSDSTRFYDSNPDSGHSIDNLAPPPSSLFAAAYGTPVTLHWARSAAPDIENYRLHRFWSADVLPAPSNLITTTNDTSYVDAYPYASISHYKLVTVDVHGNASPFLAVSPEAPVSAFAVLRRLETEPDRIRLTWRSAAHPNRAASLYRRTEQVPWIRRTQLESDDLGDFHWEDREVTSGVRYAYLLGMDDGTGEVFTEPVWAETAAPSVTLAFALESVAPNPTLRGQVAVQFELPTSDAARLSLLDIAGRKVADQEVGRLGPGRHRLELPVGTRLPAGTYFVRLVQGTNARTRRAVVFE